MNSHYDVLTRAYIRYHLLPWAEREDATELAQDCRDALDNEIARRRLADWMVIPEGREVVGEDHPVVQAFDAEE